MFLQNNHLKLSSKSIDFTAYYIYKVNSYPLCNIIHILIQSVVFQLHFHVYLMFMSTIHQRLSRKQNNVNMKCMVNMVITNQFKINYYFHALQFLYTGHFSRGSRSFSCYCYWGNVLLPSARPPLIYVGLGVRPGNHIIILFTTHIVHQQSLFLPALYVKTYISCEEDKVNQFAHLLMTFEWGTQSTLPVLRKLKNQIRYNV